MSRSTGWHDIRPLLLLNPGRGVLSPVWLIVHRWLQLLRLHRLLLFIVLLLLLLLMLLFKLSGGNIGGSCFLYQLHQKVVQCTISACGGGWGMNYLLRLARWGVLGILLLLLRIVGLC